MLVISTIANGNMHPNLEQDSGTAQVNFEQFCDAQQLSETQLVGLRADPLRESGDIICDLIANPELMASTRPNSVAVDARLAADGVIVPRCTVGAFALSADCFPVSIEGHEAAALCHVNRKAARDDLLTKIAKQLSIYECVKDIEVHIGPGTNIQPDIQSHIISSFQQMGLAGKIVELDTRVTYGSDELFSRRESLDTACKPRGNHVVIMPAV